MLLSTKIYSVRFIQVRNKVNFKRNGKNTQISLLKKKEKLINIPKDFALHKYISKYK